MARKIVCGICGKFPDCPQLKDEVWLAIAEPDELLCLEHAENRLGRHIAPDDLGECPANSYALKLHERQKAVDKLKKGLAA